MPRLNYIILKKFTLTILYLYLSDSLNTSLFFNILNLLEFGYHYRSRYELNLTEFEVMIGDKFEDNNYKPCHITEIRN